MQAGISFCFETVFSHPSKIDFLVQAKASGYQVILMMIHLGSPQLNQARIAMQGVGERVESGVRDGVS